MGRIIWEGQIPNTGNFPNGWDSFSNPLSPRVEGGHRVVDIDQDIFPVLNVEPRSSYQGITLEVQILSQLLKCNTLLNENVTVNHFSEGAVSRLDFTGVIEEHNEAHHRQKMLELPVIFCCQS